MNNIEIKGSDDLCGIVEKCNTSTDREWNCDNAVLDRVLQQNGDFAIKLGMLEALNNLMIKVVVIDGKPHFTAHVGLDGDQVSAHKVLDSDVFWGFADCDVKFRFCADGDCEMSAEAVE